MLESLLAYHFAPALAGIKPSNISLSNGMYTYGQYSFSYLFVLFFSIDDSPIGKMICVTNFDGSLCCGGPST